MSIEKWCGPMDGLPNSVVMPDGCQKKEIFGSNGLLGQANFTMRYFQVPPKGGARRPHSHPWSHYLLIYGGTGTLVLGEESYTVGRDTWIYIPKDIPHTCYNDDATETFKVLCFLPGNELPPEAYLAQDC